MYVNIYQYLASRVNLAFEEYAKTKHFSVGDDAKILAAAKKKDELIQKLEKVVLFAKDLGLDLEGDLK